MPAPELKRLLKRVEAYLAKSGLSRSEFGRQAANSPNFIPRLEGGEIRWKTYVQVKAWLDKHEKG